MYCLVNFRYILLWSLNKHRYRVATNIIESRHHTTYARLAEYLDDVAINAMSTYGVLKLGGIGCQVQIDESLFVKRKVLRVHDFIKNLKCWSCLFFHFLVFLFSCKPAQGLG